MADYGTDGGFVAYHTARGREQDIIEYNDAEIEAARLVASEWLDNRYRASFPGTKVGMRAQVREWPRNTAFDVYGYLIPSDSVPTEMDSATYEGALRELKTPGIFSKDYTPPKYESVSIDGAIAVKYAKFGSASEIQTQFQTIDEILRPILTGSGNVSALSGSVQRA